MLTPEQESERNKLYAKFCAVGRLSPEEAKRLAKLDTLHYSVQNDKKK